jgi:sugar phosphate isomerase/epimerase
MLKQNEPEFVHMAPAGFRLGLRAHDFGCQSPEALARRLASYGATCVQLALAKALPGIAAGTEPLDSASAEKIRTSFDSTGIRISVLGCYINPVHPDQAALEAGLRRFEAHLRAARLFGCRIVGTETGPVEPAEDKAFVTLLKNIERLVAIAESSGAIVGVEPVADTHVLSSIEKTSNLLAAILSPALGVIFDPVNLVPAAGLAMSQEAFFKEAFDAFGSRIVAVHAKDFRMESGRKSAPLPAGSGEMDYPRFFGMLRKLHHRPDILLENTGPATAATALERMSRILCMTT